MANNRLYLKCKGCGDLFSPMKFYPSVGWYISKNPVLVEDWNVKHSGHDPRLQGTDEERFLAINDGAFFTAELESE